MPLGTLFSNVPSDSSPNLVLKKMSSWTLPRKSSSGSRRNSSRSFDGDETGRLDPLRHRSSTSKSISHGLNGSTADLMDDDAFEMSYSSLKVHVNQPDLLLSLIPDRKNKDSSLELLVHGLNLTKTDLKKMEKLTKINIHLHGKLLKETCFLFLDDSITVYLYF